VLAIAMEAAAVADVKAKATTTTATAMVTGKENLELAYDEDHAVAAAVGPAKLAADRLNAAGDDDDDEPTTRNR